MGVPIGREGHSDIVDRIATYPAKHAIDAIGLKPGPQFIVPPASLARLKVGKTVCVYTRPLQAGFDNLDVLDVEFPAPAWRVDRFQVLREFLSIAGSHRENSDIGDARVPDFSRAFEYQPLAFRIPVRVHVGVTDRVPGS